MSEPEGTDGEASERGRQARGSADYGEADRGIRRACAAALVVSLPGCLILPEKERTQLRSYEHVSPLKEDAPARPEVLVTPRGLALDVNATWRRTCTAWRHWGGMSFGYRF